MALMRLLTVGRSLDEARDRPHRYKLLTGAMPTFGHVNGMRVGGKSSSGTILAPEREESHSVETEISVGEQTMKAEAAEAVETSKEPTTFPLGRWASKANPFRSARAAAPPAVQGELSLEKVKVVRNDLSDSDLELVASQPPKATESENVFGTGASKPSLLARIKRRLFRAKTR